MEPGYLDGLLSEPGLTQLQLAQIAGEGVLLTQEQQAEYGRLVPQIYDDVDVLIGAKPVNERYEQDNPQLPTRVSPPVYLGADRAQGRYPNGLYVQIIEQIDKSDGSESSRLFEIVFWEPVGLTPPAHDEYMTALKANAVDRYSIRIWRVNAPPTTVWQLAKARVFGRLLTDIAEMAAAVPVATTQRTN